MKNPYYFPADKMEIGYGSQKGINYLDLIENDLPDSYFDFVICNHVLEHIHDDGKAMAEMHRVLKPGGIAIVTVPIKKDSNQTYE